MTNIYTDGASRGNPGPAAWAFLILDEEGTPLEVKSGYLGRATNNEAEYNAVIQAIKTARELNILYATIHSDSEIVVKQINGDYKCKEPRLLTLKTTIQEISKGMEITYVNVPRDSRFIQHCDKECNKTLDREVLHVKNTHQGGIRGSSQTTWGS